MFRSQVLLKSGNNPEVQERFKQQVVPVIQKVHNEARE